MRILIIKVKPQSGSSKLVELPDGSFAASLNAAPVDGRANAELIGLVAQHLGCAKSQVSIRGGASARTKRVAVVC
jgi:hypothetical protein